MRRSTLPRLVALALVASVGAACEDTVTPPTNPSPPNLVTDTFSDTLAPAGGRIFPFNVASAGDIEVTLKTVTPDVTIPLGVALGTWNGSACAIVIANDNAFQGSIVLGRAQSIGALCLRVSDTPGKIVEPVTFEVTVKHP